MRPVLARIDRVAALKDERMGTAWEVQGFGRERIVVELIEVAFVGELLARPDPAQAFDEFSASSGEC